MAAASALAALRSPAMRRTVAAGCSWPPRQQRRVQPRPCRKAPMCVSSCYPPYHFALSQHRGQVLQHTSRLDPYKNSCPLKTASGGGRSILGADHGTQGPFRGDPRSSPHT